MTGESIDKNIGHRNLYIIWKANKYYQSSENIVSLHITENWNKLSSKP